MKFLHLVGVLGAAAMLSSCMKKPNMSDQAITPTSVKEVQSALGDAWGEADPLSMTPQDFVYSETEQQIESNVPSIVLQEGITVASKQEEAKDFLYTFIYQTAELQSGTAQTSTRQDTRTVTKAKDTLTAVQALQNWQKLTQIAADSKTATNVPAKVTAKNTEQMLLGYEKVLSLAYACHGSDDLTKYCQDTLKVESCDVECSNLQIQDEVRPAPAQMKSQPNCGGLAQCQMHIKKVTFDWTLILNASTGVEKQKINYTVATSPDMPFISRVIDYCTQGLVTVPQSGEKILVSVCDRLRNFKHGAQ